MSWRRRIATSHPNYWAFWLHRVSGLLLVLFLPFHFWALGKAITGQAALQSFLSWTASPWARLGEGGLALLLALHLTGGLRVLMIEALPWRDWQKTAIAVSAGLSLFVTLAFLLRAF